MTSVDFGRHSDDYGRHRPGFPDSFFDRLERLLPLEGISAFDLGTGPGTVALALARRGARVVGVDISTEQIRVAREQAEAEKLTDLLEFRVARAEEIDPPDGAVDLIISGQSWWWLDPLVVRPRAFRALRPGGFLVAASFNYSTASSPIARKTEELILELNPGWQLAGHPGIYPEFFAQLIGDGFELAEQFSYDHDQPFTPEAWRGRVRTCNGVGSGGMTPRQVEELDRSLAEFLEREHPGPFTVAHRVWALAVTKPLQEQDVDPAESTPGPSPAPATRLFY